MGSMSFTPTVDPEDLTLAFFNPINPYSAIEMERIPIKNSIPLHLKHYTPAQLPSNVTYQGSSVLITHVLFNIIYMLHVHMYYFTYIGWHSLCNSHTFS